MTDWAGSEGYAEISPDGKVVAFLADRDGELDFFSIQLATGLSNNLTSQLAAHQSRLDPAMDRLLCRFGQSVVQRPAGTQKMEMPWSPGGTPRNFLVPRRSYPSLVD